jgi:hypothetical protein
MNSSIVHRAEPECPVDTIGLGVYFIRCGHVAGLKGFPVGFSTGKANGMSKEMKDENEILPCSRWILALIPRIFFLGRFRNCGGLARRGEIPPGYNRLMAFCGIGDICSQYSRSTVTLGKDRSMLVTVGSTYLSSLDLRTSGGTREREHVATCILLARKILRENMTASSLAKRETRAREGAQIMWILCPLEN